MQKFCIKIRRLYVRRKRISCEIGKKAAPVTVCVATGAAIGSMFAPGLGTAIGSGIGAIIWGTGTIVKAVKEKRIK